MKRKMAAFALLVMAGCPAPPKTKTERRILPEVDTSFVAKADLVAFGQAEAVFYAVDDDGIAPLGRVPLLRWGAMSGGWRNRDELYLNGDDRTILRITPSEITQLDAPPRHQGNDDEDALDWEQLAVDDDGVWWGRCQDGDQYEGVCDRWAWVNVESGERKVGGERGRAPSWPADAPGAPSCDDTDQWRSILESHWVSADHRVVVYGYRYDDGRTYTEGWALMKGCDEVVVEGAAITVGPGGIWIGSSGYRYDYDNGRQLPTEHWIYRGAKRLGTLEGGDVMFYSSSSSS